ncbi:MAG: AIR synthase related protein [Bacteroidia bacterium]|nr:AIR synthase related protein [Bacteroidia bacterium]
MQKTFADLGRVAAIKELFEGTGYQPFCEPLFIDTAKAGYATTSNKVLLEGVDFNLEYFPLKHLGYKSVLAATGELYAVRSTPKTLALVLGISAKLDFEQIKELWSGVVTAAKEHGYASLSLELQPSKNGLCISVTATGIEPADIKRPKAQSMDLVCVSGRLGAAFLGQQVLEHKPEELEKYKMMLAAYLKPELEAQLPQQLTDAGVDPSFGYFVGRGLADAVLRLNRDSGLGVKIYADKIPFEGNSFSLGKEMNIDPISAAMNGGDDYVVLFVIPSAQYEKFGREFKTFEAIGHLAKPEVGAVLVSPDGLEHQISAPGWNNEE